MDATPCKNVWKEVYDSKHYEQSLYIHASKLHRKVSNFLPNACALGIVIMETLVDNLNSATTNDGNHESLFALKRLEWRHTRAYNH